MFAGSGDDRMDPKDLKFTQTHEWCFFEGDVLTLGLTVQAVKNAGEIVFVELPDPEDDILTDEPCGEIEAMGVDMPIHSPVDGRALEVNTRLIDDPGPLIKDPYGDGWLVKIAVSDPSPLDDLLTYDQYMERAKKS